MRTPEDDGLSSALDAARRQVFHEVDGALAPEGSAGPPPGAAHRCGPPLTEDGLHALLALHAAATAAERQQTAGARWEPTPPEALAYRDAAAQAVPALAAELLRLRHPRPASPTRADLGELWERHAAPVRDDPASPDPWRPALAAAPFDGQLTVAWIVQCAQCGRLDSVPSPEGTHQSAAAAAQDEGWRVTKPPELLGTADVLWFCGDCWEAGSHE